jgi:hypothetical protein
VINCFLLGRGGGSRVDGVPPKADRVGGKEKGDNDGHPVVVSSSFSSADPPSERTRSRFPLTTIPEWDLVHNLPRQKWGALIGTVVFNKTQKMANVGVDGYRIVDHSQSVEVHEEDHVAQ